MRTIITIFFLSYVLPCAGFQSPSDFERELSRIADEFKEVILDEDECDELKDKVEDITEEIEELLEESEDFSSEEIALFKQLKTEAEGIEDFIGVVAGVGNATPKLTDFITANERIKADIYYISKKEHCVDILEIRIGEYMAYVTSNNSSKGSRVIVKWKTKDNASSGTSELGMSGKTVKHLFDSRDRTLENNIDFQNISCQEFKKWGQ